jgi:ubiquinone/menaquinone biosynthesis C-methylase UbiE
LNNTLLNKALYNGKLFDFWSKKEQLLDIETYFINKYLKNKQSKLIEAGTGGGRLIFNIESLGFTNIEAFDFAENMIAYCNEKKERLGSSIDFKVADATDLKTFKSESYDYLIYLQQILCFIDFENLPKALNEAHRLGKDSSIYLFSFLNWESKVYNPLLSYVVNFFRILRGEKVSKFKLPWLNINGSINWKFLNKNQPQNIWFKEQDIIDILEQSGFSIIEIKSRLKSDDRNGHLHFACKKIVKP